MTSSSHSHCSDLDAQIEQLRQCKTISESDVQILCHKAREILIEESNVQLIDAPVIVKILPSSRSPNQV